MGLRRVPLVDDEPAILLSKLRGRDERGEARVALAPGVIDDLPSPGLFVPAQGLYFIVAICAPRPIPRRWCIQVAH